MYEEKNLMELLVAERIREVYPTLDCCNCNQCRKDVYLRTMNMLLPKYVSTPKGEIMARIHAKKNDDKILEAIRLAAAQVREHPRHDK